MLLMLALWSCGRRAGVVQAQRQIHRAFVWPEQIRWGGRGQLWAALFGSRLPAARTCLVSSLGLVVARLSGLWLALASLALFEPIAVAVQFEDVDVVGQSVEQCTGQPLGADDLMMPPSSKELCVVLVFSTQRSACSKG